MVGVGRRGGIEKTSLISLIGGEEGAATYGPNTAPPDRRPKRLDTAEGAVRFSMRTYKEHDGSELEADDSRG
jgi:hypothetical protein